MGRWFYQLSKGSVGSVLQSRRAYASYCVQKREMYERSSKMSTRMLRYSTSTFLSMWSKSTFSAAVRPMTRSS